VPFFLNQIAVITGASSGIGKAIAQGLAKEGAHLCIVGRKEEKLEVVANYIKKISGKVSFYIADLGIDEDIYRLITSLQTEFEGIDILIHSAGVISMGYVEQLPVEDFDWQYRINLRAPYCLTQALLPMLRSRRGQIVFINSTSGLVAKSGLAQYSATKHALKAIADSLRAEVNEDGLRVISIFPGRTATPMQETVFKAEGRKYSTDKLMLPEDVSKLVLETLKLPKTAEVTDLMVRPSKKLK